MLVLQGIAILHVILFQAAEASTMRVLNGERQTKVQVPDTQIIDYIDLYDSKAVLLKLYREDDLSSTLNLLAKRKEVGLSRFEEAFAYLLMQRLRIDLWYSQLEQAIESTRIESPSSWYQTSIESLKTYFLEEHTGIILDRIKQRPQLSAIALKLKGRVRQMLQKLSKRYEGKDSGLLITLNAEAIEFFRSLGFSTEPKPRRRVDKIETAHGVLTPVY